MDYLKFDDMVLEEENHIEVINSYTEEDWAPLLELIPGIENTVSFGTCVVGEPDEDGVASFPYYEKAEVVERFLDLVYRMPIVIDFDWGEWDEGREFLNDESFDFDSVDIPTKCKLITVIVRNDRYNEGALVGAFEKGIILEILKSVKEQV